MLSDGLRMLPAARGLLPMLFEETWLGLRVLKPDLPMFKLKAAPKPFIRSTNVSDIIRAAIRSAGFAWQPYVLRAYFNTQLIAYRSKGSCVQRILLVPDGA